MNRSAVLLVLAALIIGLASGYWLAGFREGSEPSTPAEKKILYYRHPTNPSVTSPIPAKDEMGMDYVPVYEDQAPETGQAEPHPSAEAPRERRILYYRNPMGLPDTSPVPKKDSMGMDYIPVYADEETPNEANIIKISPDKIQKLGVRTAEAEQRDLVRTVRAVGLVEPDERRFHAVTLKFDGYIEKLHVNATGQSVKKGQPLFELYSPDLVSAQNDYLIARNSQSALNNANPRTQAEMENLVQSSLERLRYWGISETEIRRLEQQAEVQRNLVIRSPVSGVVMEKMAVAGMRAMAGEALFKLADLSSIWIIAEVFEQELGLISAGQTVRVRLDAYPGRTFDGKVTFIYPTLNPETRTVRVRIELPNPQGLLKPMMYAHVELAGTARQALAIPQSSVLEGGKRTQVLVDRGEGRFEPRIVRLGTRGDEWVEVLEGLKAGENVVVSANFLIDAESNLKSALESFDAPEPPPGNHADHGGM
ncbi:efflux RND transporter periplasmic adaptor subunit [Methylocaldum sp.]|uniref:efflux RND transporter periplasmic adaptor subunit n=1 Tax=Methylocaldum sp. TaxID=1969727 RepID=UPI002D7631B0|nr:efflux RND transporter periplasmic adaptor subunit [Methylocaldum sp.]HYE36920.1 efflux RND transporter periplasmic adaptor subunit [Methylocaldum sp.]